MNLNSLIGEGLKEFDEKYGAFEFCDPENDITSISSGQYRKLKEYLTTFARTIAEKTIEAVRVDGKAVEAWMLKNILYIGEELPEGMEKDPRPKFVLLGIPQELIDAARAEAEKRAGDFLSTSDAQ